MQQFRCKKCQKLLCKESVRDGEVEIKCPACNTYNYIILNKDSLKKDKKAWN